MANTEEQLILDIITKACKGAIQPFRLIVCWEEFWYYLGCAKANKLILKTLKTSVNGLIKEYCRGVIKGISDITLLLAYNKILGIIDFYERDLAVIQQMLDEYDSYLGNWGNFWNALLGGRREL